MKTSTLILTTVAAVSAIPQNAPDSGTTGIASIPEASLRSSVPDGGTTSVATIPESSLQTSAPDAGTTGIASIPEGSLRSSVPDAGTTGIMSIPEGSLPPPANGTATKTAEPTPGHGQSSTYTNPIRTSENGGGQPTSAPPPVPTGAAATNKAFGALAALGMVAAYLI